MSFPLGKCLHFTVGKFLSLYQTRLKIFEMGERSSLLCRNGYGEEKKCLYNEDTWTKVETREGHWFGWFLLNNVLQDVTRRKWRHDIQQNDTTRNDNEQNDA